MLRIARFTGLIIAASLALQGASRTGAAIGCDKCPPAPDAVDPDGRTYPSLPGAIHTAPEWLKENTPFDLDAFFVQVPPEENAAPLYLEALYEFAPRDMENCVSPEERETRGALLREREDRMLVLQRNGGDAAIRAALLDEFGEAFDKVALAQRRKYCVFDVGYSLDSMLHHAQAARAVVRLLDWRVEFALVAKDPAAALDAIEMGLRLGRDLRRRGPIICQLVSVAIDSVIVHNQIYALLGFPNLTVADCDRLLKILEAHRPDGVDPAVDAFRSEWISFRDLLHLLEIKERLGDLTGAPASSNGVVLAGRMAEGERSREIGEEIDDRLAEMGPPEFAAEVDALNRYFGPLVNPGERPVREFDRLIPEQADALADMTLLSLLKDALPISFHFTEAVRRDRTRMGAIACVAALRRWQLAQPDRQPADLLTACQAAGIKAIPTDEYSRTGEPLKWIHRGGQVVVYSVAKDGKDDQAERDWNFGRAPGDFIFPLPLLLNPQE